MRKYILTICSIPSFCIFLFSQNTFEEKQKITRHQIDSLKKTLPTLSGTARIDCLNTLAFKYLDLGLNWKALADSSYPYALAANNESKRIDYKTGLAYSYLRLGVIEDLKYGFESQANKKKYPELLNNAEKYLKQALSIGEKLNDQIIIARVISNLGEVERDRGNIPKYVEHSLTAVTIYEKNGKVRGDNYKDYGHISCTGCKGYENWVSDIFWGIGHQYASQRRYDSAAVYMKKSAQYLQKTDKLGDLAGLYSYISFLDFRLFAYDKSEQAQKNAIKLYNQVGDQENELRSFNELVKVYDFTGEFEKGLEYSRKSIALAEKLDKAGVNKSSPNRGMSFYWMCRLYKAAGDYDAALDIIRRSYDYFPKPIGSFQKEIWTAEIGDLHRLIGNKDSAVFYLNPFLADTLRWTPGKIYLANLYLDLQQYDKALQLIIQTIENEKQFGITVPYPISLTTAASIYLAKKDYNSALKYASEGLAYLRLMNGRVRMIDNYKLLSEIFHDLKKTDSAYYYLHSYMRLKDSLINRQLLWKLGNYKKEVEEERKTSQINLLNKDNQLKNQQLKQQAQLKNFLFAGLFGLLLITVFIYRNLTLKRKNEKLKAEQIQSQLRQKATDLEMQALRAQMNPHFIFNCLSSINRFILKNETEAASDYLTRFSRLIRMVLIHSRSAKIVLKDELEMLRLYLDMEQLRFKNSFDYNISFTNSIDPENVFIPPLLLQPFCENAIWHGLMHKKEKGYLEIKLSMQDHNLVCVISDNGIGRVKSAELKTKSGEMHKSLGLKITAERLALLNQENGVKTSFHTEDVGDGDGNVAGTKVILKINYKETAEHHVS